MNGHRMIDAACELQSVVQLKAGGISGGCDFLEGFSHFLLLKIKQA